MAFLVFYVPCPDESTARRIAGQVVERRLAACANLFPMQSLYWWEEALQHDNEWVALLKTPPALEQRLEQALLELHPYETPCLLRYEVRANPAYEDWIVAETIQD
ncbi:MAG: divalent-cation tolerance protein CutA [Saprospiraceae bacterium]|nr:divalent-cation tolerance protein CutA [Saprospiraceae bacterium]